MHPVKIRIRSCSSPIFVPCGQEEEQVYQSKGHLQSGSTGLTSGVLQHIC